MLDNISNEIPNNAIESISYKHWQDFTKQYESFKNNDKRFLFRGQSNYLFNENQKHLCKEENVWQPFDLKTTFQRKYSHDMGAITNFCKDLIRKKSEYSSLSKYDFINMDNYLPIILFLRHAGVPMPVLDVTFDPLTALYFASNDLAMHYGVRNCKNHNDSRYISIYEFDTSKLIEYYDANKIAQINYLESGSFNQIFFVTECESFYPIHENMKRQDGAFFLFDDNLSIDNFIGIKKFIYDAENRTNIPKPIKHHKINYYSVLADFEDSDDDNLFRYLATKGKAGFLLFVDDQALLHDFINPNYLRFIQNTPLP